MSTFDYAELVGDADEMIAEFGRTVQFVMTSSAPNDTNKPWRAENVSDDTTLSGMAAIIPWESRDDKDSVRAGTKYIIVSASVFPADNGELFDQMIDSDGSHWHLHDAQVVNPGGTRVLYTFNAEQ